MTRKGGKSWNSGTSVALRNKSQIIDALEEGKLLRQISAQNGVSKQALSQALMDDPAYERAKFLGMRSRMEEQYEAIINAQDAIDIARAREAFRAASWFAEREYPAQWGNKQTITQVTVDASQLLGKDASDLLSHVRSRRPAITIDQSPDDGGNNRGNSDDSDSDN